MSVKFNRQYEMTIYPTQYLDRNPGQFGDSYKFSEAVSNPVNFTPAVEQAVIIKDPFTLIMDIRRENMSSVNMAHFQIYNLSESVRNQIFRDKVTSWGLKRVTLKAGYSSQGPLPVVFDGNIWWCTSTRPQGQVNYITEINAWGWDFATVNAHTTMSIAGKVPKQQVVDQLIKDISAMGAGQNRVSRGYVTQYKDQYYSPNISENSWNRLKTETDNACTIDLGVLHIVGNRQYIPSPSFVINSASGLLGAPKRSENLVVLEMLFEPSLILNQKVTLQTRSQKAFDGDYKIYGLSHTGIISGAVGGKCQTTVTLYSLEKESELMSLSKSLV